MSSQTTSLPSSGTPTTTQASMGTPATSLISSDTKTGIRKPVSSNPKVVVQPVNPPINIALPMETQQSLFTITQHKHGVSAEMAKIPISMSNANIPITKPPQVVSRPAIPKPTVTSHLQPATYMVPITQPAFTAQQIPSTQPVSSRSLPGTGTHIIQTTATTIPSTHLMPTVPSVLSAQSLPASQVRLPTTVLNVTAAAAAVTSTTDVDVHKMKVSGATVQVVSTTTQPNVAGTPAGHSLQQYVRGLSVHPGMIPGSHAVSGQSQQHAFASHLPRGAVAAAAMSAPKSGMTTAILRTTSPVSQAHFLNTAPTMASTAVQSQALGAQQRHQPSQVHTLPAQHHIPGRLHSPAGLATVAALPTCPPGITRANSPGTVAASRHQPHPSSTEAHRPIPHTSLPQPPIQTAGHPFRPDIKQLPKAPDKKQDGKQEVKLVDSSKPEVKLVGPGPSYSWVTITQHGTSQQRAPAMGGAKHTYITAAGLQRATHPPPQAVGPPATVTSQVPISLGSGHPSSSLVTATTLSHHTVPSQSIIHSSIRTSAITVTTVSTQPQSVTTTSIPVAKVYPRQQMPHPTRPSTPYAAEGPYIPTHNRNSPSTPITTTGTTLPPVVTMGDGRSERPPQSTSMAHAGYTHSPTMQPFFYDTINYRHPMMSPYGPPHSFPSISAAGVRPTLAESHIRHTLNPTAAQNSSVAAAVVAAAHAATVGGPGRHNQVNMMVDSRRQIPVHNTMGIAPSLEGSVHPSTSTSLNTSQNTSNSSPNPNASPRPSILKRRINNDSTVVRKLIPTGSQPSSPKTEQSTSTTGSPKQSDSLTSSQQSMESNASEVSQDSTTSVVKIKQEPDSSHTESGSQAVLGRDLSLTNSVGDCSPSPRKKPRKQQHKVATEHHDILEDQSTDEDTEIKHKHFRVKKEKKEKKPTVSDVDHMNVVHYFRRPCLRLIDTYRQSWKPTHNHFERYSDVRPKDEKKVTIHEIANQRGIVKKTDGWKIRHITYQFEDLSGLELDVFNEMKEIKEGMAPWQKPEESDTAKIYELIQGNLQRSQYVMEHLEEAKHTMLKLLEHKPKVMSIIKNHANKRHAKKKHSP